MSDEQPTLAPLEERIRDHFNNRIMVEMRSRCDYHVHPEDFEAIAQRTGARIEYVPAHDLDGLVSHMTLYLTAGKTRVYPDKEIERGRFGVWEPKQSSDPEPKREPLVYRVGQALLEHANKALESRSYGEAVMLIEAYEKLMRSGPFGMPAGLASSLASGAAIRVG